MPVKFVTVQLRTDWKRQRLRCIKRNITAMKITSHNRLRKRQNSEQTPQHSRDTSRREDTEKTESRQKQDDKL